MYRKSFFSLCLVLFLAGMAVAQDTGAKTSDGAEAVDGAGGSEGADGADKAAATEGDNGPDTKTLSGMSVLGNDEAPMSLFIVPWKSSELGVETNLQRTLDERDVPVDRDVFMREVEFYQVSVGGDASAAADGSKGVN